MTGAEILLGVAVAGSVLGTVASSRSQVSDANNQAAIAEYNAKVADQEADMAIAQSRFNAGQIAAENKRKIAAQRAAYGAAGVTPEGTPLLVMSDAAAQDEIDQLAARYEGDVAATRARSSAQGSRYQAAMLRSAGKAKAQSTLLTGLGQAAGMGMSFFRPRGAVTV